jgi:hypothetical protein
MPSNPDPSNSGKFSRPIDAPSLPPWSRAADDRTAPVLSPAPMPQDDETPTLSGDAFPTPPVEDPRELARRLAAEAKQKAAARKVSPQEDPMRADDPRDLARRLAEEAKRRLGGIPQAPPAPEPPITHWEQSAVRVDDAATDPTADDDGYEPVHEPSLPVFRDAVMPEPASEDGPTEDPYGTASDPGEDEVPDPDPEPPADLPTSFARGRSLAERAAATKPKVGLSAVEALAAARLAEARAQAPAPAKPAPRPVPAPAAPVPVQAAPVQAPPSPRPRPPATAQHSDLSSLFGELLPGAAIEPPIPVTQLDVFRALWRAHRARALHDQQVELVCTASLLLDAADRGVPMAAARVTLGTVTHAVWVDLDRRVLLAAARPAEIYLAGL